MILTILTFAIAKSEILNLSKQNRKFAVTFQKHQKQKCQQSTSELNESKVLNQEIL